MGWLDGELTTLALCWRVERRDGVTIGLTDHDRDLVVDGLVHRAAPGMTPSAIKRSDGLDADTMDVAGALTSGAIAEADLLAGRWDGARVALFAVDWSDPANRVDLGEGTIGAVETKDGARLGEVIAVPNYGASDLLEIRPVKGGATLLVPFVDEFVPVVDVEGGRIVVDPPAGLFEEENKT